jgi:hypothetical protein
VSPGRWWRRGIAALVTFAIAWVLLAIARTDPDPVRLALLVGTCTAVLGLVLDAMADNGPSWDVPVERPSLLEGGDPRLAQYVGLLEAHESARVEDRALRDRLGMVVSGVLAQKHGLSRDDPRAAELLGPELTQVLEGPPRRLTRAEVDRCLTRIEEL